MRFDGRRDKGSVRTYEHNTLEYCSIEVTGGKSTLVLNFHRACFRTSSRGKRPDFSFK